MRRFNNPTRRKRGAGAITEASFGAKLARHHKLMLRERFPRRGKQEREEQ